MSFVFQLLCHKGQTISIFRMWPANHAELPINLICSTSLMITEAKGSDLSWIFSGQVNWRASSCNRKRPWRHLCLPDEENGNYSGKSIFQPNLSPLSTKKLLEGGEGDRKIYIPDSIIGSLFAVCIEGRPLVFINVLTKHKHRGEHIQPCSVYERFFIYVFFWDAHSFWLMQCLYGLILFPFVGWFKNREVKMDIGIPAATMYLNRQAFIE